MEGKGEEVESRQDGREVLFTVSEIMLEVVPFGLQDIEGLGGSREAALRLQWQRAIRVSGPIGQKR